MTFKRFEKIKEIKYGYIDYIPFHWHVHQKGELSTNHKGIGYDVLNEILTPLEIKLTPFRIGSNWDSIFNELVADKKFDVIFPLFETRTRLYDFNVTFCSPLFYSNIGLYIKKTTETATLENKYTFTEAIDYIKGQKEWKGNYSKGELADNLMKKHELTSVEIERIHAKSSDDDFKEIIRNIIGDSPKENFTFMEVFKAETIINNSIPFINILKPNELLYPVSFAVRKEDTVLKNLINLRLMEMENTQIDDGKGKKISILENIIKKVATSADIGIDESTFKNIFIRKYDFKK